jgi:DNA-binding NarL/FixJ family response regulator
VIRDLETDVHLSLLPTPDFDEAGRHWQGIEIGAEDDPASIAASDRLRVVIVDDAPSTRRFLRAVLEHCSDFDVAGEASDGVSAIEQAEVLQPDLVLLDVSMPTLDGASALKGILDVAPNAIVIIVSGMNPAVGEPMLDAGAKGFLAKGMPPYELLDQLGAMLGRKVTMRRSMSDHAPHTGGTHESGSPTPDQPEPRALVFEADPTTRHLITEALTSCEVAVIAQSSTHSTTLAVVDLAQPELVVLDLAVNGAPALSYLEDVCRRSPHSVVVVYSAFEQWKDDAIAAGAAAFVRKPRIEELTERVRQLISTS